MEYSDFDRQCMELALKEAKSALERNDFPIGAVLSIDDRVLGAEGNRLFSKHNASAHAETQLITKYGTNIRMAPASEKVTIYSTLEPCLMCMGAISMNKLDRLVYALMDPFAGATNVDQGSLPQYYRQFWPEIQSGLYAAESKKLFMDFFTNNPDMDGMKRMFERV